jgi:hypothetical protein
MVERLDPRLSQEMGGAFRPLQRRAVRAWLGCRRATEADAPDLPAWLRQEMLPQDPDGVHVQDYAMAWYRERRIGPSPPYGLSSSG